MSRNIKKIIDSIIEDRAKGNAAIAEMTKAKLILKGIYVDRYDNDDEDDQKILEKLIDIKRQWNSEDPSEEDCSIKTAYSQKQVEEEAVLDIQSQINHTGTRVLIYFASSSYDQGKLSRLMNKAFGDCLIFGCSSAGERINEDLLTNSIVVLSLGKNLIEDAKVEVIENLSGDFDTKKAFESFASYFNENPYTMDTGKYVGIVFVDGLSLKEEKLMDQIGNLTNVSFIGGSAGDNIKFEKTTVYAHGKAYDNSAVVAFLKMQNNASFKIIKTENFNKIDQKLIANKVDEESRKVIEFNYKPASQAYATALGLNSDEDLSDYFFAHPVGLVLDEDNFLIRSPENTVGTDIKFCCSILENMEVSLLESGDIVEDTRSALDEVKEELGENIVGSLCFDCIYRRLELEQKDLVEEYGGVFSGIPTVGFYSYGEINIGHMNQTMTMLVFEYDDVDYVEDIEDVDDYYIEEKALYDEEKQRLTKENLDLFKGKCELERKIQELEYELALTTNELRRFTIELEEQIKERTERENEIEYLSYHDALTGLYNRRYYEEAIEVLDNEYNLPISIIIGDIDELKETNDNLGHAKGDELIKKAAESLVAACRKEDIVARIGGDEFVIALPNTSNESAKAIVERIQEFTSSEYVNDRPLSISFGYDTKENLHESVLEVTKNAEGFMYKDKMAKKNR